MKFFQSFDRILQFPFLANILLLDNISAIYLFPFLLRNGAMSKNFLFVISLSQDYAIIPPILSSSVDIEEIMVVALRDL